MPPIAKLSPSSSSRSNCDPSRANRVPSLKILPNTSCTVTISARSRASRRAFPADKAPPRDDRRGHGFRAATRRSALPAHIGDDRVGGVEAGPSRGDRNSSTLSMIAAHFVAGSLTTYVAVKVGSSKKAYQGGLPVARHGVFHQRYRPFDMLVCLHGSTPVVRSRPPARGRGKTGREGGRAP